MPLRLFPMTPVSLSPCILCLSHPRTQQAVGEGAKKALTSCYLVPVKTGAGKGDYCPPHPPNNFDITVGKGVAAALTPEPAMGHVPNIPKEKGVCGRCCSSGESGTFQSPEEVGFVWGWGKGRR